MALELEYTLEEARLEVIARMGFPVQGGLSAAMYPFIDSFIRQAQATLYEEVDWVKLWKDEEIELIEQQDAYDWPDDCRYGQENSVFATDSNGKITKLSPGLKAWEISEDKTPTTPQRYFFKERMLYIYPIPDVTRWKTLTIRYIATASPLREDGDRLSMNSQAVILKSLILAKIHYGQAGVPELERDLVRFMVRIRAQNTDSEGVQLGRFRRKSKRLKTWTEPSIAYEQQGINPYDT